MKHYLYLLSLSFVFFQKTKSQAIKPNSIEGVYKVYFKTYNNDSIFKGYINFNKNSQYNYFGKTAYNAMGVHNEQSFLMFSQGKWELKGLNTLSIKDNKSKFAKQLNIIDSINYSGSSKLPFDSNSFTIQVFDNNKKLLSNELIYFKSINRLIETDSIGFLKFAVRRSKKDTVEQLTFLGHEPFYPASIDISSNFNQHFIQVFLKRVPQNGFIQEKSFPLSIEGIANIKNNEAFTVGKAIFIRVNRNEALGFISQMELNNANFITEFKFFKNLF